MRILKTFCAGFFFFAVMSNLQAGCPDLTGTYVCESSTKKKTTVNITQTTNAGVMTYSFKYHGHSHDIIADNQDRTDDKGRTRKAYCAEDMDILHYTGTSATKNGHARFSLNADGSLMIEKELHNLETGETKNKSVTCSASES